MHGSSISKAHWSQNQSITDHFTALFLTPFSTPLRGCHLGAMSVDSRRKIGFLRSPMGSTGRPNGPKTIPEETKERKRVGRMLALGSPRAAWRSRGPRGFIFIVLFIIWVAPELICIVFGSFQTPLQESIHGSFGAPFDPVLDAR